MPPISEIILKYHLCITKVQGFLDFRETNCATVVVVEKPVGHGDDEEDDYHVHHHSCDFHDHNPPLSSSGSLFFIVILVLKNMRSILEEIKSYLKTSDATAIPVAVAGKY